MDKKVKFEIIRQFGPSVFKIQIPEEILEKLNNYTEKVINDKKISYQQDHGRALVGDVAQEIRSGDITIEEGKKLIRKYNGEYPKRWIKELCEYLSINPNESPELKNIIKDTKDYQNKEWSEEKNKNKINEKNICKYLLTKDMPDPDILIRTGNTKRLSNFLLWQLAYSEIFFEKKLWPDFNEKDYNKIINKFKKIKRNFGKI